ncbi:MAG: cytochrome P450, partial [Betaproteobacteria bacterium]|nr:cytochrome P450 [Betaproteobacteria bacterium]
SETTPMAVAGALYYLAHDPAQKAQILADNTRAMAAFRETCRYDQPTNMLARRAARDFELSGARIAAGDNLLFIYASANRDERRFENADTFDMNRSNPGDLSFGTGTHFCLGATLAQTSARLMLERLFASMSDYTVIEERCRRAYGEHLNGFIEMVIKPVWKTDPPSP